jgi:hypothetical protein
MELTDKGIHLLARLSRDRGLYADCKGAELDALQELGILQWFDARLSTTPFEEDPRPLFKLLGISGRIDYFWIAPVENWRELVGPEVAAKVDAIDEIGWAVNSGPFTRTRGGGSREAIVGARSACSWNAASVLSAVTPANRLEN